MEASSIMTTGVKKFQKDVGEHPEFALIMVKVLGEVLQNSFNIIEGLVFMDSRMRLTEFLIKAAEDKGIKDGEGVTIELGLNVEDISRLVGTSRQTISVMLTKLTRDGYIRRVKKGTYHILDLDLFKESANR
jgi:CRP-like cAMP-binding protein